MRLLRARAGRSLAWPMVLLLLVTACGSSSTTPSSPTSSDQPSSSVPAATGAQPSGSGAAPSTPASVDSLTIGLQTDYTDLRVFRGSNSALLQEFLFDGLVWVDGQGHIAPWLATSWDSDAAGKVWTFHLRNGVKWQDGQPFTADDVVFSFDFAKLPAVATTDWKSVFGYGGDLTAVATDPSTVTVTLADPAPEFPAQIVLWMILPKHVWQATYDEVKALPDSPETLAKLQSVADLTGTGPYKLTAYEADKSYTFQSNPDYFLGAPLVKTLTMAVVPDESARLLAVQSGELDGILMPVSASTVATVGGSVKTITVPSIQDWVVHFNNQVKPFSDLAVRKALTMAIDTHQLVTQVLGGNGIPGNMTILHPTSVGAATGLDVAQDIEGAKQVLEAAGYRDTNNDGIRETPDGVPMSYDFPTYSSYPDAVRSTELIAGWAKEIGIELKPLSLEGGTMWEKGCGRVYSQKKAPDYPLLLTTWGAPILAPSGVALDSFNNGDLTRGLWNCSAYSNDAVNATLAQLQQTSDSATRLQLMTTVQQQIAAQYPYVPLYWRQSAYVFSSKYDGWRPPQGGQVVFLEKRNFLANVP